MPSLRTRARRPAAADVGRPRDTESVPRGGCAARRERRAARLWPVKRRLPAPAPAHRPFIRRAARRRSPASRSPVSPPAARSTPVHDQHPVRPGRRRAGRPRRPRDPRSRARRRRLRPARRLGQRHQPRRRRLTVQSRPSRADDRAQAPPRAARRSRSARASRSTSPPRASQLDRRRDPSPARSCPSASPRARVARPSSGARAAGRRLLRHGDARAHRQLTASRSGSPQRPDAARSAAAAEPSPSTREPRGFDGAGAVSSASNL